MSERFKLETEAWKAKGQRCPAECYCEHGTVSETVKYHFV